MVASVSLQMDMPRQTVMSAEPRRRTYSSLRGGQLARNRFNVAIENIVASADFHQKIDLESIAKYFPTAKYDPNTFPGLIYRARKPDATMLIFASGKMIVAGAKSDRMARKAVSRLVKKFKMAGLVILAEPDVTIRNVVASADLSHPIDLEDMATRLQGTIYEPEQFPGLICRLKETRAVLLVFANGRLVCSGARSLDDVEKAVSRLYENLVANDLLSRNESDYEPQVNQQLRPLHVGSDVDHDMEEALRDDLKQHA